MKFYFKPILSVLVLAVLLGYAGCGKDKNPAPSTEEVQLGKLNGTWKVGTSGNVTLDAVSQPGYSDFTLTLNGTAGSTSYNYSTAGRPSLSPWPASGTWTFGSDAEKSIIRDPGTDQVIVNYTATDTQLELTFDYTQGGEAAKVNGQWVFTLTKQ